MEENIFSDKFSTNMDSYHISAQKPKKNCQDYSIISEDSKLICLADGCGSSKNSEFGSLNLCHITKNIIDNEEDFLVSNIKNKIVEKMSMIDNLVGSDSQKFDSTLLFSIQRKNDIHSFMYGDGNIIVTNKENKIEYWKSAEFDCNAPYYLSYCLDKKRNDLYAQSGIKKHIKIYSETNECFNQKFTENIEECEYNIHPIDGINLFLITSDGISSFYNYKTGEKVQAIDVIRQIIDIKSRKGEFIQRRVKRVLQDFAKNDIYNYDDLSVCGFIVE